jgi:hypothetical protein
MHSVYRQSSQVIYDESDSDRFKCIVWFDLVSKLLHLSQNNSISALISSIIAISSIATILVIGQTKRVLNGMTPYRLRLTRMMINWLYQENNRSFGRIIIPTTAIIPSSILISLCRFTLYKSLAISTRTTTTIILLDVATVIAIVITATLVFCTFINSKLLLILCYTASLSGIPLLFSESNQTLQARVSRYLCKKTS